MYNDTNKVPEEIQRWNWGAFMSPISWGIGNRAYLSLLCLIPIFNFVWVFICGACGNSWAWKANNYKDLDTFYAVQSTWNRAGFVEFILWISFVGFYVFIIILFVIVALSVS